MAETNCTDQFVKELNQLFNQIKEVLREESEQNHYLKQKIGLNEDNSQWSEQLIQQFRQQITDYQKVIDCQQNSLIQLKQIEEDNKRLNEKVCSLELMLKTTEETNREWIEKIKTENNANLSDRENQIKQLELEIVSKDVNISQLNRQLIDYKNKFDDNINEIRDFYENKISNLYKEFDNKYEDLMKKNENTIHEIRYNCMRSVEKTKDELGTELIKAQNEIKDLKEKNSHLRLELEATKMNPRFDSKSVTTSATKSVTTSAIKSVPKSGPKTKQRYALILDSEDEQPNNGSNNCSNTGPKRKKLVANNDSYLDFVEDN